MSISNAPDISELIEARQKLERSHALLIYLARANSLIARCEDSAGIYSQLCELATELDQHITLAWVGLVDPRTNSVLVAASSGSAKAYLEQIAISQNTNLAVVAPGIAEALLATGIGLIAAIPAVVFYNKLNSDSERILGGYESFADEFATILSRQLDA